MSRYDEYSKEALAALLEDFSWEALNLAQDMSCEFELCDYGNVKPEYRHEESTRRQEAGMELMRRAYDLSGVGREGHEYWGVVAAKVAAERARGEF